MEIVGRLLNVRPRKDVKTATEELRQELYNALVNFDIFIEPLTEAGPNLGSEALAIADRAVNEALKGKGYDE